MQVCSNLLIIPPRSEGMLQTSDDALLATRARLINKNEIASIALTEAVAQ